MFFVPPPGGPPNPADRRLRPLLGASRAHARSLRDFSVSPLHLEKAPKKKADRRKGMAEIMRHISASFTKLINSLCPK